MLNEQQQDALIELLNIATARTAASLSDLTGQRVLLDVPSVEIYPIQELAEVLERFVVGDVATVHQIFNGQVAGDAFLLLDYQAAVTLVDLMTDDPLRPQRLNESAREVLTEIGNILLNACLSVFGDMLQVRVSFSVPRLHLDDLRSLLRSLMIGQEELQYSLLVHTNFRLRQSEVGGYLVMVLGVASLDLLIQSIEQMS